MDTSSTSQPRQISALIADLGEPHGLTRQRARLALAHIGAPAIPSLLEALTDQNGGVRLETVKVLGEIHDPSTVNALIEKLLDEETSVRWAAMESLIHTGRACLRPLLEKFVKTFDSAYLREGVHHILHVFKDRYLLTDEEMTLFEKLDQKEIPGFDMGWNTQAAWAAEKALESLDRIR